VIRLIYRRVPEDDQDAFPEDVRRIVEIGYRRGFEVADADAQDAWTDFSDSHCAGWLILPADDDEVWGLVRPYLTPAD
jgi:hypothetical protein